MNVTLNEKITLPTGVNLFIKLETANSWKLNADHSVEALAINGRMVYLGGNFSQIILNSATRISLPIV